MRKNTIIITIFTLLLGLLHISISEAQTLNRAGLIVRFSDGEIRTFCISFEEDTISGYDLLKKSNLNIGVNFSGEGLAVCNIEGTGCPPDDSCLLCQRPNYWSYWHFNSTEWEYSLLGTGYYEIKNGDVDGWVWGNGQSPPPIISYEEICESSAIPTTNWQPDNNKPTKTRKPTFVPPTQKPPSPTNTLLHSITGTPTPTQLHLPTSTSAPGIPSTITPATYVITETSPPTVIEKVEIIPTITATIKKKASNLVNEIPTIEYSGPPKKAAGVTVNIQDQAPSESTDSSQNDESISSIILDFLQSIQEMLSSLFS